MRGRFSRNPNAATGTVAAAAASGVARRSSHSSRPVSSLARDNEAVRSPDPSPVQTPVEASTVPTAVTGKDIDTNVSHDRGAGAGVKSVEVEGGDGIHVSPPSAATAHADSTWLLVPTSPSEAGDPTEDFPSAAEEGDEGKSYKKASPTTAAVAAAAAGAAAAAAVGERDRLGGDGESKRDMGKEEMDGDRHRDFQVQVDSSSYSRNPRGEVHGFAGRVQDASGSSTRSGGRNDNRGWPVQGDGSYRFLSCLYTYVKPQGRGFVKLVACPYE